MKHAIYLFIAAMFSLVPAFAHAEFPDRPVFLTIGFGAGGNSDLAARAIAGEMNKILGQPVVIVNRGGSGGALAIGDVMTKPTDGYNIGAVASTAFTIDTLVKKARYHAEDVVFLGSGGLYQTSFCSNVSKPWKTMREMLDWAKKNNHTLTCASPVNDDSYILKVISKKEGVQFKRIPTKGGGETFTKVLGDQVDFGYGGGLQTQYVLAGKMNNLLFLGTTKPEKTPQTPSFLQTGLPELAWDNHFVFFAPKDVPKEIIKKLSDAIYKTANSPTVQNILKEKAFLGAKIIDGSQCKELITSNLASYKKLLEMAK